MIRLAAIGVQAAWRAARGQREALGLLAPGEDGFRTAANSFWSMALCLPGFLFLRMLDLQEAGAPVHPARGMALDLLGYVIGWIGFCLLTHRLAQRLGRARLWPRFITLWNWCNLLQYLMLVAAALPDLLGLPGIVSQTAWLVAMGWAFWLEWFAAKLALDVPGPTAAALVGIDISLGLFITALIESLG
jgi:hypothetical protein